MKIILIVIIALCILSILNYYCFGMRRVNSPHMLYKTDIEKIYIDYKDNKIYGELLKPRNIKTDTLIIGSHGFNGSMLYYKQALGYRLSQEGYALFAYDFINGSRHSKSGGQIEYMSPLDEKEQLITVYNYFKDKYKNIILAGESQGGLISTLAYENLKDIKGLILYYPAYVAIDDAKKRKENNINEMFNIKFKSNYTNELAVIDLESIIKSFDVPTILIHGDKDRVVDVKYAYWAKEINPKIELHIIKDKDHGFDQKGRNEASDYVSNYLKNINI